MIFIEASVAAAVVVKVPITSNKPAMVILLYITLTGIETLLLESLATIAISPLVDTFSTYIIPAV